MAKKDESPKIVLERQYTVPLRTQWLRVPRNRRSKKAIIGLRGFITKHMKAAVVKIATPVNLAIWKQGIRRPPHHITVIAKKDSEGTVSVSLPGETAVQKTPKMAKHLRKGEKKEKKGAKAGPEKAAEEQPAPKQEASVIKEAEVVSEKVKKGIKQEE
ncbi:60S ribosomal protein L31 [Candidatus Woesearchaeota archaeon]|nr:60S ribosomal protein L31 [Candidatus Woesearchaeota archaeon]